MQLSLLKENLLYTCVLPEKQRGQYWVTHTNAHGYEERVISVEGVEGKWVLKSNKNASILDHNNQKVKELILEPSSVNSIALKKTKENAILFSDPITNDRKVFKKLNLPTSGTITIGRVENCDIQYAHKYTSSLHAELIVSESSIFIRDNDSSNGTFVNGVRVSKKMLLPGDIIYLVGLKIIVGKGYIALNNPDGLVIYKDSVFTPFVKQVPAHLDEDEDVEAEDRKLFYRSPRFKRDIEKTEIKIDPPPTLGNMEQIPLMLMLGPSITMGMTSLFIAMFALQNVMSSGGSIMKAMPMFMMSFSMLLGTILWPILTRRHEKKKKIQYEKSRQEKYTQYLDEIRQQILVESEHQSQILHENNAPLEYCVSRIKMRERNLWERTRRQNDFVKVRLGVGSLPLEVEMKYPEKRFTLDDDNLQEELHRLVEAPKVLEHVPISISFIDQWISGVIGNRERVIQFIKGTILQLAALHSYDELKLVFIYDRKEHDIWDYVKWLPHVWSNDKTVRFIATNMNEVKELSAYFESEMANRELITSDEDLKDITPYYVVFSMDKQLALKTDMVQTLLKKKKNIGFSLINLYDELMDLPKECSWVIECNGDVSKIYDKNDTSAKSTDFRADRYVNQDELEIAVSLANIELDSSDSTYALPKMLTFLDMFGVGKIEHLNALTRWKENDPTLSLETPIGVDPSGETFNLDLHEKFHGPHGLIAGMTGSGKSEFIMTFILSLAVNYHPHEVAFILIDYKGGGMANAFSELPHLAGTITNLDGASVKRSLISIQSELKRRQFIFSETSKQLTISNMDIYKYQKLFREGLVTEPLQQLFIVSDEFAELKTQQPEFMAQLVSAARIGRSLGVHLILATQKPSGVVDDQIWSNSRFRICLKVQEKADSMDMIKKPDAAELSITGRFYVQVGFNELFVLGQSAWGGAPYYPSDRLENHKETQIEVIDNLGRIVKQVKAEQRNVVRNPPKQIDEVNKYLATIAAEEEIVVRPLWLDPIPEMIYLKQLNDKYSSTSTSVSELNPIIGEFDDPFNQSQLAMRFPLTRDGNAVVYGASGSGKTTFLTTLMYALMSEHTPSEINLYILDFASETLRAFASAPHVGDVLLSHETEKINNLFKMLYKEIGSRKKLFADYGGDYQSYIQATHADLASIIVVIHNFSAFTEIFDDKEEAIAYLTREGLKYGIYFILTALNPGAVRYRILQNFKQLYVLQLNDTSDYSSVLGNVDGVYPSNYKGRGIFKTDQVYEFQIAHVHDEPERTFEFVRDYSNRYAKAWMQPAASKIPILPEIVDVDFFSNELSNRRDALIPIGVEKQSLKVSYFDFEQSYINLVLSQNNDKATFLQGLAELLTAKDTAEVLVIDPETKFVPDDRKSYTYVSPKEDLEQTVINLFNTLVIRNNSYKDAVANGEPLPTFEKLTCIICSLSSLFTWLSEDSKDKLKVLLEKGEVDYCVHLIISDSISYISSISYEGWFKAKASLNEGIWLGNGIADQYQFKLTKTSNELYQDVGEGFGYVYRKGYVTLIKQLTSKQHQMEVELVG